MKFELNYSGLKTETGDTVQIRISETQQGGAMSGQLFKVGYSNQQTVYANGQAFLGSAVRKDAEGFVTEISTPLSDTISKVEIRVANVENLGRVQPLSAKFDIEIRDS